MAGVVGTTLIQTLRGPRMASKLAATGDEFYGFTWNGSEIVVGKGRVTHAGVSDTKRVVYVEGGSIRVRADAQALARETGEPVSLCQEGTSLLPLYLGRTSHGYPTYKQIGDRYKRALAPSDRRRVRLVARMVYEWKTGRPIEVGMLVRHIDGDHDNCEPENLRLDGKPNPKRRHRLLRLKQAQEVKLPNNHRIDAVQDFDREDIFDIESVGCDNLEAGGIFLVMHGA